MQSPDKTIPELKFYEQEIRERPVSAEPYVNLARLMYGHGRRDVAARAYAVARSFAPQGKLEIGDLLALGNSLAVSSDPLGARQVYREALQDRPVVLVFSPDTGVSPHFIAQCVVARVLQERGHTVLVLPFPEAFHPFLLPSIEQLDDWFSERAWREYSARHRRVAQQLLLKHGLSSIEPAAFWSADSNAIAGRVAAELSGIDDLRKFQREDTRFGTLALFDLALTTKCFDFSAPREDQRRGWQEFIQQGTIVYEVLSQVYQTFNIVAGLHFNDYSPMLAHRLIGERLGVPIYSLTQASHLNIDRRKYIIAPRTLRQTGLMQESIWERFRDLHLDEGVISEIAQDAIKRFRGIGSHAYSPAKAAEQLDVYRQFDLSSDRRLLVAYTSSRDEIVSVGAAMEGLGVETPKRDQPFGTQIEWLQELVAFVEASEDFQLIVRIHPRESRNKRESQVSQHLSLLLENFDRPFEHCRFVWPEEKLSSYDIGEAADLVLTSWSSIGLEFARLGVPVLTATNGVSPFPHDDFLEWGQTRDRYFEKLRELLDREISLPTISRAFRWYNLYHLGSSVDLGDIVPEPSYVGVPKLETPHEAKTIEDIVIHGKSILDINYERLVAAQSVNSASSEQRAIVRALQKVFHFIFTGEEDDALFSSEDLEFRYYPSASTVEELESLSVGRAESRGAPSAALGLQGEDCVFYIEPGGRVLSRQSVLCARLVAVIADRVD